MSTPPPESPKLKLQALPPPSRHSPNRRLQVPRTSYDSEPLLPYDVEPLAQLCDIYNIVIPSLPAGARIPATLDVPVIRDAHLPTHLLAIVSTHAASPSPLPPADPLLVPVTADFFVQQFPGQAEIIPPAEPGSTLPVPFMDPTLDTLRVTLPVVRFPVPHASSLPLLLLFGPERRQLHGRARSRERANWIPAGSGPSSASSPPSSSHGRSGRSTASTHSMSPAMSPVSSPGGLAPAAIGSGILAHLLPLDAVHEYPSRGAMARAMAAGATAAAGGYEGASPTSVLLPLSPPSPSPSFASASSHSGYAGASPGPHASFPERYAFNQGLWANVLSLGPQGDDAGELARLVRLAWQVTAEADKIIRKAGQLGAAAGPFADVADEGPGSGDGLPWDGEAFGSAGRR